MYWLIRLYQFVNTSELLLCAINFLKISNMDDFLQIFDRNFDRN